MSSKKETRIWSSFQRKVFYDIQKGSGHTVISALAGSGKTSTIIEGFKYIPRGKKTLMVAFNKAIAEELRKRASSYVDVFTIHALSFRAVKKHFPDVQLDEKKCQKIVAEIIGDDYEDWPLNVNICKCVSLCKNFLIDTPDKIADLIDQFDIETFDLTREVFIAYIIKVLSLCKSRTQTIDFDDMIHYIFCYGLSVGKWDFCFADEVQDFSKLNTFILLSACKKDGRIIAVGDINQAIYLFRGADSQSIPYLIEKLNAKVLTLPITYRCPKKVVYLAQKQVPEITHTDNAIDGIVENLPIDDLLKKVRPGDFIISRTNAPLIKYCMALLKANVPANIQGRDVGANLSYMIKKSKAKSIDKFIRWLEKWKDAELLRVQAEKKNPATIIDKAECLSNLCEGCLTIGDLNANIEKLFSDVSEKDKVVLGTTHKMKGLERNRVFVLTWTYRQYSGHQEEANLWYTAITRSQKELYLVQTKNQKEEYNNA